MFRHENLHLSVYLIRVLNTTRLRLLLIKFWINNCEGLAPV